MVTQGYTATLVATTLATSRSSLYYRKKPRGSRADRSRDEEILVTCGEKLAYGYRRVTWWLRRKEGLIVNRKRELRLMVLKFHVEGLLRATTTNEWISSAISHSGTPARRNNRSTSFTGP